MAIKVTLDSIKAGVSKTTQTANLGGILADLRRKILLVDIDVQPTLSCDYLVQSKATIGFTHLITDTCVDDVISQVTIPDLDIVLSDDLQGRLRNVILPTPDGRVRLKHILIRLEETYNFQLYSDRYAGRTQYGHPQHRGLPPGRHGQASGASLGTPPLRTDAEPARNPAGTGS